MQYVFPYLICYFHFQPDSASKPAAPCDIPCPNLFIPPQCAAEDFIMLNGTVCKSCDVDLCVIKEWPPKVAVPYCAGVVCIDKHIPQKCVMRHFRRINGFLCRDCDLDLCIDPPPTTPKPPPTTNNSLTNDTIIYPLCPKLHCKLWGIPKECVLPTYQTIDGQKCRTCDEDACRHPPALRIPSKRNVSY